MRKILILTVLSVTLIAQAGAQNTARDLFNEAESRFQSQDYELAVERYEALLRQFPLSDYVPDAQFKRALSLYRVGRDEEALALFDRVASRYRSSQYLPYVPFWRGAVQYRLEQYREALESLTGFIDASDDRQLVQQARLYAALCHTELDDDEAAIATLETLLEETDSLSENSYAVALLASLYFRRAQHDAVILLYTQIDPANLSEKWRSSLTLYAAESYFALEDYDAAAESYRSLTEAATSHRTVAYQRLFQIATQSGIGDSQEILRRAERDLAGEPGILKDFWLRVGIESYSAGKLDLAELYFRRIWDLRESVPVDVTVPLYLAEVLSANGSSGQAVVVLEQQLDYSSDGRARVLARLGALYVDREEWEKARETLSTAIDEGLDDKLQGQAWYHYAFASYRLGRFEEAAEAVLGPLSNGTAGAYAAELMRLQSRIYRRQDRMTDAVRALRDYTALAPGDSAARLELVQLHFLSDDFVQVIADGGRLLEDSPELRRVSPSDYGQLRYMLGLAQISERSYQEAIAHLQAVPDLEEDEPGYDRYRVIQPYVYYYLGWSHFRLGNYREAQDVFETLLSEFPANPFAAEGAYLAGFSAFSEGRYSASERFLRQAISLAGDDTQAAQSAFLLGQALRDGGDRRDAAVQFQEVVERYPESAYADDALYEYAAVSRAAGDVDAAGRAYRRLSREYPDSPLASEALYRVAEILLSQESFEEARDAYFEYRSTFPDGEFLQAALYWGGVASAEIGEDSGALLQWERLISEFPDASLRPEAMRRAAELYEERSEFRKALNLYTSLIAAYPEEARAIGAERKRDELVLLIGGVGQREAELLVTIEENNRATTAEGRDAIVALGQLAINDSLGSTVSDSMVLPMLRETVERSSADPQAAAEAQFLLAEHAYRQNDYRVAGTRYLEVVTISPPDRDLMARSLYRAAEMMKLAGQDSYSRRLVNQLESEFPTSEWTAQARELHPEGGR
jgi:TolA-binding protein